MKLRLDPVPLTICRLTPLDPLPAWALATSSPFISLTRTAGELSVVCPAGLVPADVQQEPGWCALVLAGPLDFALTGVLASVLDPLAQAGISIFALSTYDTDHVLVRSSQLEAAIQALVAAGHTVTRPEPR